MVTLADQSFLDAPRWAVCLQAIYDLVPIVLFLCGSIILLRTLYNKMVKGNYALLAAGSIMVFTAGFFKALHKFILGVGHIDYVLLDHQFSTTQSIGFALLFVALIGMFTSYNKKYTKVQAFVPLYLLLPILAETIEKAEAIPTYDKSMPFVAIMVISAAGFLAMMIYISARMKKTLAIVLFALAVVFMVGMGYLSSKRTFTGAWIQISVNVCYQLCFFLGCVTLKKAGLGEEDALQRK